MDKELLGQRHRVPPFAFPSRIQDDDDSCNVDGDDGEGVHDGERSRTALHVHWQCSWAPRRKHVLPQLRRSRHQTLQLRNHQMEPNEGHALPRLQRTQFQSRESFTIGIIIPIRHLLSTLHHAYICSKLKIALRTTAFFTAWRDTFRAHPAFFQISRNACHTEVSTDA